MQASIIIPHFNMPDYLSLCLDALNNQSVPRNDFEIIIVDNGSSVNIDKNVKEKADKWITYTETQDPYNCRNIGITIAKYNIIAFLDTKCIPHTNWLFSGLKHFNDSNTEIIAGNFEVKYDINDLYQVFFAISYFNQKSKVEEGSGILTGNLFALKSVFNKIGGFPENRRSGGDIVWSQRAMEADLKIDFVNDAIVSFPAKRKNEILKTVIRDGKGAFYTYQLEGKSFLFHLKMILYHILPDKISRIKKTIGIKKEKQFNLNKIFHFWVITWKTNLYFAYGYLKGATKS